MNCDLCNAINQEFRLIHKTNLTFSVICKQPLKKGHCLVLPIRHSTNLIDLTAEESKEIFVHLNKLKELLKSRYNTDPMIFMNTGVHSTQDQLHFHIIPAK